MRCAIFKGALGGEPGNEDHRMAPIYVEPMPR